MQRKIISLIFCLQICGGTSAVFADTNTSVENYLKQLTSIDFKTVSSAQGNAGDYPYKEVFKILIRNIKDQILRSKTPGQKINPYILTTGLVGLSKLSGPEQYQEIEALIKDLSTSTTLMDHQYILASFNLLVKDYKKGKVKLQKFYTEENIKELLRDTENGDFLVRATVNIIRDTTLKKLEEGTYIPIIGRDKEAKEVLDVLARITGANVLLSGPAGSGKTSIAQLIDYISSQDLIPDTYSHKKLKKLIVLETTPSLLSSFAVSNDPQSQAAVMETYIESVLQAQRKLGRKIIIFIDEAHMLHKGAVEAIKRYSGSESEISFIFASTSEEFKLKFSLNTAFLRRLKEIPVEELTDEEVEVLLKLTWIPRIETETHVTFDIEVVRKVIKEAEKLLPHGGKIDGSIKVLNDLAIINSPIIGSPKVSINKSMLSELRKQYYSLPIDPNNFVETNKFFTDLKLKLKSKIHGQDRMIDDTLDVFKGLLTSGKNQVASIYITGPTGTGKTYLGQSIAQEVLSNSKAYFEINGNDYAIGGYDLNKLFGAPNGIISSDTTKGSFIEWLDDNAKGGKGGVLVINEIDKASPDFLTRIMELLDRGVIEGGDGKKRYVKNLFIIMTSNRGVEMIFPDKWHTWTESELKAHINKLTAEDLIKYLDYVSKDNQLPPEIKNRITNYTVSTPILKTMASRILEDLITAKTLEYKEKDLAIEISENLKNYVLDYFYHPKYGVRPLQRGLDFVTMQTIDLAINELPIADGDKLILDYDIATKKYSVYMSSNVERKVELPAPNKDPQNPLENFELLEVLDQLEAELNANIFGQEEMIAKVSTSVFAHKLQTLQRKALSLFLVGSTGTGKTQTAKALAFALYKSKDRIGKINLGNFKHQVELRNTLFSPPKGIEGHDEFGEFEKFLIENPEGGVLLFDESSNMGGDSPATKADLFKMLYEITDEHEWTSSVSGKVYDLSKYVFLFTGNDGDELFQGIGSDDLRLSIWKQFSHPNKVRQLLRKSFVPEPFIGRLADLILMKPLTSKIAEKISDKFLVNLLSQFDAEKFNFEITEEFIQKLSTTFYTQDQGARSIETLVGTHLYSAILKSINWINKEQNHSSFKIRFSIMDNLDGQIFLPAHFTERQIVFQVAVLNENNEVVQSSEKDLTGYADPINLMTEAEATRVAYHEAGHAVVNEEAVTQQRLSFLTIKGRGNYLGYARYEDIPGHAAMTEQRMIHILSSILAGSAAQHLAGYPPDTGMRADIEQAKKLIQSFVDSGALPELIFAVAEAGSSSRSNTQKLYSKFIFESAWNLAIANLIENWSRVELFKAKLLQLGELDSTHIQEILNASLETTSPQEVNIAKTQDFLKPRFQTAQVANGNRSFQVQVPKPIEADNNLSMCIKFLQ